MADPSSEMPPGTVAPAVAPQIVDTLPPLDPNPLPPPPAAPPAHDPDDDEDGSHSPHSDHSMSEDDDDDSEDDEERGHSRQRRWRPIAEDTSVPCDDEIKYIESKKEHSATDHAYWEKKTFFNLSDPELKPGENGRIDWVVENFNGTKENPNNEEIMYSPIVKIGGYDWRIKLFPWGDNTQFISLYLECVSMHSPDFVSSEEFEYPPFPFLAGTDHSSTKKRTFVSAQVSAVMYNPEEPRVYEYKTDAHQFHKGSADYGWRYFSREPRLDFHYRPHGQRKAILTGDKLGFSAYIRIIHDPTGCMWEHNASKDTYDESLATTGLRPFSHQWPHVVAAIPLLHYAPFRHFLQGTTKSTSQVHALQTLLLKLHSRKRSSHYGKRIDAEHADAIVYLKNIAKQLRKECGPGINPLIGTFEPEQGAAVGSNRLKIKGHDSVQAALQNHQSMLATPSLLTLELERQEFDRTTRQWSKITQKVSLDQKISVSGHSYTLFAFATHCGDLSSNRHNVYVRPGGPTQLWYAYRDGQVIALTSKQALEPQSHAIGTKLSKKSQRNDSMFGGITDSSNKEVAYAITYVRDDTVGEAFKSIKEETWTIPEKVKKGEQFSDSAKEPEQRPYYELEGLGSVSNLVTSGAETPPWTLMDGEDVVMSEADDDDGNEEDKYEATVDTLAASTILTTTHHAPPASYLWSTTVEGIGQDYYSGQMLGNNRHGDGHLIALSGDEYRGQFQNGKPHGTGIMTYALTGNIYNGDWEAGEHHGQGTLTEHTTGNVFTGGWKHGKKHGSFVLKGVVTEEDKGCCTICYEKEMNTAFYDCGHVVACKECAAMIDTCPVCRKRVGARLQLYGVKMIME